MVISKSIRFVIPALAMFVFTIWVGCAADPPEPIPMAANPDSLFHHRIVPFFKTACEGCHFRGGDMYATMPFDDPRVLLGRRDEIAARMDNDAQRAEFRLWTEWVAMAQDSTAVR